MTRRTLLLLAVVAGCSSDGGGGGETPDPPPPASIERSLAWVQPALLDDPAAVGLGRVMDAFAGSGSSGGERLAEWFDTFAVTAHSQRFFPATLADEWRTDHGADESQWDLDVLPFKVTGVHNRVDLLSRLPVEDGGHCGEFRVSMASTHPSIQPMHLIFLFRQPAGEDDEDGDGVHCRGAARRWAELAPMPEAEFLAAAREILDESLVADRVLIAETVEQTISPWEWRQWNLAGATPENPPLFQTVDVERVNTAGAERDAFLAFVEDNAAALDARTIAIPPTWRSPSERQADGIPRETLDLTGVAPAVLSQHPNLRKNIELVGCPVCHTADAQFVQTTPNRTFSPFYEKELDARRIFLDALGAGDTPLVPFGPLQPDPVLPD